MRAINRNKILFKGGATGPSFPFKILGVNPEQEVVLRGMNMC